MVWGALKCAAVKETSKARCRDDDAPRKLRLMKYPAAHTIAVVFGLVFVMTGLLGFIPNPIVCGHGLFKVNAAHNIAHFVSGAILLASAFFLPGLERFAIAAVAAGYAVIAIVGLVSTDDMLFGVLQLNQADRYLHVAVAAAFIAAAYLANRSSPYPSASRA